MVDKRDDKLIMAKLEEETKRFNHLKNSLEQFAEIEEGILILTKRLERSCLQHTKI
jgi:hypothetical protein